jgi:ATP-dependent DNA ligase
MARQGVSDNFKLRHYREGIVSKRLGSPYRAGRSPHWIKVKNPKAPAVTREAEEDWN